MKDITWQGNQWHGKSRKGRKMKGKERIDMERKGKAWKGMARKGLGLGLGLGMARKGRKMQRMEMKGMEWKGGVRHGMEWIGKESKCNETCLCAVVRPYVPFILTTNLVDTDLFGINCMHVKSHQMHLLGLQEPSFYSN